MLGMAFGQAMAPVSYTHLDVYKRQIPALPDVQHGICDPAQLTVSFAERPIGKGLNNRHFLPLTQREPTACAVKTMRLAVDHPQRTSGDFQQTVSSLMPQMCIRDSPIGAHRDIQSSRINRPPPLRCFRKRIGHLLAGSIDAV